MKPPFSYYGGKQHMVRHILPPIPKHTVYVEPFCGGATVLFAKQNPSITNLIQTLDKCQGSFLLSMYSTDLCPSHWEKFAFTASCSAIGTTKNFTGNYDRTRTEVIYRRFNTAEPIESIQKLYESAAFDYYASKPKEAHHVQQVI